MRKDTALSRTDCRSRDAQVSVHLETLCRYRLTFPSGFSKVSPVDARSTHGDVAQLGEHCLRKAGVESSNLFISTTYFKVRISILAFFFILFGQFESTANFHQNMPLRTCRPLLFKAYMFGRSLDTGLKRWSGKKDRPGPCSVNIRKLESKIIAFHQEVQHKRQRLSQNSPKEDIIL